MAANKLTPEQAAYLAGLLDGEGNFHAANRTHLAPGFAMRIKMTSRVPLQYVHTITGVGTINELSWRPKRHHRTQYVWSCSTAEDIKIILVQVLPWLVLKRTEARLMLMATDLKYVRGVKDTRLVLVKLLCALKWEPLGLKHLRALVSLARGWPELSESRTTSQPSDPKTEQSGTR